MSLDLKLQHPDNRMITERKTYLRVIKENLLEYAVTPLIAENFMIFIWVVVIQG